MKPVIAITMGDPAGVGPEVCLRALASEEVARICSPVIFGDASVLRACAATTGLPFDAAVISEKDIAAATRPGVCDLGVIAPDAFTPGTISAATGHAAFTYVNRAIDAALAGSIAAITTGPLNKEAMHMAGFHFPGHTEIFASRTNTARSCMMQYSEEITCTFVTVHVGYAQVPALLTKERILDVIELTAAGLARIRGRKPKLVVCGLNPHAGEHGLFGDREEERIIAPAIEEARARPRHRRPAAAGHRIPAVEAEGHRRLRVHVSRPGPHSREGARLRLRGEHHARPPHHPHERGPRHRARHRVAGKGGCQQPFQRTAPRRETRGCGRDCYVPPVTV